MKKFIVGFALLFLSELLMAEKSDFGIVWTYYGFSEFRELCKWKHHGSYVIVDEQFQAWKKENRKVIESAFEGLKEEASRDEVKAEKLKVLEPKLTRMWAEEFVKMDDEATGYLCFFKGQAKDYFQSLLVRELE